MNMMGKMAAVSLIGAGTLALSISTASAEIVCNGGGVCWHTHSEYHYPPTAGVIVHPNDWRWGPEAHYRWEEHEGRGYWHENHWVQF